MTAHPRYPSQPQFPSLAPALRVLSGHTASTEQRAVAQQVIAEARFPALTPPEQAVDRAAVWIDRAASVCLIAVAIGVVALITYVITLPGAMK